MTITFYLIIVKPLEIFLRRKINLQIKCDIIYIVTCIETALSPV